MTIQKYLEKMKGIQEHLLAFIEDEVNIEENFKNLNLFLTNVKIHNNKYEFMSFLHLLLNISNNHQRGPNFFYKIDQILKIYKDYIKIYLANSEIFNIFKSNKRVLLFLIEEKIMIMDKYVIKKIVSNKYINADYPQYFSPELKPFIKEQWFLKHCKNNQNLKNDIIIKITKELTDDFYENRKIGENENYVCKLIQKDSVDEFVNYLNQNNYSVQSNIETSIFETNPFLIKKQTETSSYKYKFSFLLNDNNENDKISLIEYATFLGSIQIFKYLLANGVKLTPSLLICAIHSKNTEMINILDEKISEYIKINHLKNNVERNIYFECFKESIKCFNNDIAVYIQDNHLQNENDYSYETLIQALKYYNFTFINEKLINISSFIDICKYDYCLLACILINNTYNEINKIQKHNGIYC